jgi:phosphoribosyl 1,2-cyclic phosphodiesterase
MIRSGRAYPTYLHEKLMQYVLFYYLVIINWSCLLSYTDAYACQNWIRAMDKEFYVKFWGVRGTIPTPDPRMMGYGGNTSCVEIRCGDLVIACDAGTGIIQMGEQPGLSNLHILLSHTHMDHIMGLCCMRKLFSPDFSADIWAGHLLPDMFLHEALAQLISPPLFPISLHAFPAQLTFHDITAGRALTHSDFSSRGIKIYSLPLNHPDRATGYRIEYQGHSVCYITDIEHLAEGLDEPLLAFVEGCDLFIYDSTYDDKEFSMHQGWGHSTWQQAVRLGEKADVGLIALFHHDPLATDAILDARVENIKTFSRHPTMIAREGFVWSPAMPHA